MFFFCRRMQSANSKPRWQVKLCYCAMAGLLVTEQFSADIVKMKVIWVNVTRILKCLCRSQIKHWYPRTKKKKQEKDLCGKINWWYETFEQMPEIKFYWVGSKVCSVFSMNFKVCILLCSSLLNRRLFPILTAFLHTETSSWVYYIGGPYANVFRFIYSIGLSLSQKV